MKCKQKSRTHVVAGAGLLDCFSNQDNRLGLMIHSLNIPQPNSLSLRGRAIFFSFAFPFIFSIYFWLVSVFHMSV